MGLSFLLVIFTGIFIAPLVLGSFIVSEDSDSRTLNGWFGFATLVFIGVAVVAGAFLFLLPRPV